MPSIADCAVLALDIYDQAGSHPAGAAGWRRVDGMCWAAGFAAGTYTKGRETVVAFRGTEPSDPADLWSDAGMIPLTAPGAVHETIGTLLRQYDVAGDTLLVSVAPHVIDHVMRTLPIRLAVRRFANSVPNTQLTDALAYFDRCRPTPRVVTGHSLGGALAQLVAQRRSVTAVAFNSPHMGDLRGVVPMTSRSIIQVNAVGDPLSLATRTVGNLAHGEVIWVDIPLPARRPPTFERPPLGWSAVVAPVTTLITREVKTQKQYHKELLTYLGEAMLHYHSMENLMLAVRRQARFSMPLTGR